MNDPIELLRRVRPVEDGPVPPVERLWERLELVQGQGLWERLELAQGQGRPGREHSSGRPPAASWRSAVVTATVVAICLAVSAGMIALLSNGRPAPRSGSSTSAGHPSLKEILGVLRRPATAADRHLGRALAPLERLEHLMRGQVTLDRSGARVATVPGHPKIILVPVTRSTGGPPELAETGLGGSDCCMTVNAIENGTATGTWGGAYTRNYGMIVVPDGVARVQLHIGRTLTAVVHDNVAMLRLPGPVENLGVYPMTWLARSGAVVRRFHTGATTKAPPSHPSYPRSLYPLPARHPPWGSPGGCASLAGVRRPDRKDDVGASGAVLILLDDHIQNVADRAYWPVFAEQKRARLTNSNVLLVGPAARSPYAPLVRNNCGAGLVSRSIRVVIGPPHGLTRTPARTMEAWVIDRRGHWFVWWSRGQPGRR